MLLTIIHIYSRHQPFIWDFKCVKRTDMSKLPPLITQHTFLSLNRSSFRTAATTVAEEGSITIFILSSTSWVALIISNSLTSMMSSLVRCYRRI
jgi:hypothetical protein